MLKKLLGKLFANPFLELTLYRSGADILRFAGDAMVAIYTYEGHWKGKKRSSSVGPHEHRNETDALVHLCHTAIRTALRMQDNELIRSFRFTPSFVKKTSLEKTPTSSLAEFDFSKPQTPEEKENEFELRVKFGIGIGKSAFMSNSHLILVVRKDQHCTRWRFIRQCCQ